jgi:hypothetical protein
VFCTHVAGCLSSKDECLPEKETEMITEDITFVCYLNTHARAKADRRVQPESREDVQRKFKI